MLILTRRPNEAIIISVPGYPPIRLLVLEVRGKQVAIGTDADTDIGVDREEIYHRKQASKSRAA